MNGAALLEDPSVQRQVHRFTIADYHRMGERGEIGERTELIEGVIIHKMPKSPLHRYITEFLRKRFLDIYGSEYTVSQEQPLSIAVLDSEPEPDLSVVKGTLADFLKAHPTTAELVVEVAVTSLPLDRAKLRGYALAKVREVWIIRADNRSAEVYTEPQGESYAATKLLTFTDSLHACGTEIPLAVIFPKVD
ncbi:MAG: Uma2 family endonuclease [Spirochaetes bacterium]|nr:Uma2 family endonuclease [Spirochaetota bacterium]